MPPASRSDIVGVPVNRLRKLTRRTVHGLFIAYLDLAIGALLIVLLVLYLGGRRAARDAEDARTRQLVAQSIYEARVGICEALRAQHVDPGPVCDGIAPPGIDPDGGGPLRPAPFPPTVPSATSTTP